jgi:hypothetical protein
MSTTTTTPPDPNCDWPRCYDLGFIRGWANPGTEPPSGHSEDYRKGWKDGASKSNNDLATDDPTQCDKTGWPSCYSIGFVRGWDNPGTEPPSEYSGLSEDYRKGWKDGASKSIPVSPTPTIPISPTPAYQLTVIVVPSSDRSTLNVSVTTSNNYQGHANLGATIGTTWTFKIPENQGRSLTVCIDSGFLSQRKGQTYAATGKNMSVTLYAP